MQDLLFFLSDCRALIRLNTICQDTIYECHQKGNLWTIIECKGTNANLRLGNINLKQKSHTVATTCKWLVSIFGKQEMSLRRHGFEDEERHWAWSQGTLHLHFRSVCFSLKALGESTSPLSASTSWHIEGKQEGHGGEDVKMLLQTRDSKKLSWGPPVLIRKTKRRSNCMCVYDELYCTIYV